MLHNNDQVINTHTQRIRSAHYFQTSQKNNRNIKLYSMKPTKFEDDEIIQKLHCNIQQPKSRRHLLKRIGIHFMITATAASATEEGDKDIRLPSNKDEFQSSGFTKQEYTNSITASRDTNISPKEAYDTISSFYISKQPIQDAQKQNRIPRALDLGAGAGVSTQLLFEMGYRDIDAVDWSGDAWRRFVMEETDNEEEGTNIKTTGVVVTSIGKKEGVRFYEMDDERFRQLWRNPKKEKDIKSDKYDAIVYNFAVNESKAKDMAMEMLTDTGKLLAPVNNQIDYWLKQNYRVYDKNGNMLWQTGEVGAWSVQVSHSA